MENPNKEKDSPDNKILTDQGSGTQLDPLSDMMFVDFLESSKAVEKYKSMYGLPNSALGLQITAPSEYISGAFHWGRGSDYAFWKTIDKKWQTLCKIYIEAGRTGVNDYILKIKKEEEKDVGWRVLPFQGTFESSEFTGSELYRIMTMRFAFRFQVFGRNRDMVTALDGMALGRSELQVMFTQMIDRARVNRNPDEEYWLARFPVIGIIRYGTFHMEAFYRYLVRWPSGEEGIYNLTSEIESDSRFNVFDRNYAVAERFTVGKWWSSEMNIEQYLESRVLNLANTQVTYSPGGITATTSIEGEPERIVQETRPENPYGFSQVQLTPRQYGVTPQEAWHRRPVSSLMSDLPGQDEQVQRAPGFSAYPEGSEDFQVIGPEHPDPPPIEHDAIERDEGSDVPW